MTTDELRALLEVEEDASMWGGRPNGRRKRMPLVESQGQRLPNVQRDYTPEGEVNRMNIQDRIGQWHRATFPDLEYESTYNDCGTMVDGPLIDKLKEEFAEFVADPCGYEAADMVICLYAWCDRHDMSLDKMIVAKFEEVRNRDQRARDKERGIE